MSVITGQTATILFTTMDYATGVATDADVLPTGVLYINGIASASSVTITNITTGVYRAVVTMPVLSNGDYVSVCISATVNAIAGKHKAFEEVADTVYLSSRSATGDAMALTAGGVDDIWDEQLTGATHNVPTSAGRRLRQLADVVVADGTIVSATANTAVLDAGASAINGAYDPAILVIVTGAGAGQCRLILEYDGAARRCWIDRDWKVNPGLGDEWMIIADAGREHVNEGHAQAGGADWIQLNVLASDEDDAYNGQTVFIRSGTGQDQARRIADYDGATHTAYVTRPWDVIPDATSSGAILPTGTIDDEDLASAVWDATMASYVDIGSTGETLNAAGSSTIFPAGSIEYTYTVTNSVTTLPVEGVDVWISTDLAGTNIVWRGVTDAFGVVRNVLGDKPYLDPGTYYFWKQKSGFTSANPDTEVVT